MHWIGDFDRASPLTWVTLAIGMTLLFAAWLMDAAWFDAHILPSFFISRHSQWTAVVTARWALVVAGLLTIVVARPILVRLARSAGLVRVCLFTIATNAAVAAAIISTEMILRTQKWDAFQARNVTREPRRQADARLGWTHLPGHSGRDLIGDRWIAYAFDHHGYRVGQPGTETDLAAPSILFTGESTMLGFGLDWAESIPARVGIGLGVKSANLAVTGYATDQAFMRLRADLPHFRCPLGVVSLFMPSFLDRNLNADRPHLDAGLRQHEPHIGWRLATLARHALHYRDKETIDEGVAMTAAVLRATEVIAQPRGAWALIVVPVFMPESRSERIIRRRVLHDAGLDYVMVPLDRRLQIVGDGHPNRQAAALVASAIIARLRERDFLHAAQRNHAMDRQRCRAS